MGAPTIALSIDLSLFHESVTLRKPVRPSWLMVTQMALNQLSSIQSSAPTCLNNAVFAVSILLAFVFDDSLDRSFRPRKYAMRSAFAPLGCGRPDRIRLRSKSPRSLKFNNAVSACFPSGTQTASGSARASEARY